MSITGVGVVTGTLTALNQAVTLPTATQCDKVGVQITGTFVGTISFEGTLDGTNWVSVALGAAATPATPATSASAAGVFVGDLFQFVGFRVKMTAFTSGSAVITVTTANVA